ncbi:Hsp70 family protein [Aspergillus ibericus CBS 121593]|uniref:Actin-like ATPase domain-containing protein n=1 Tax=Aspergillus ibericus CBS 121593 TaxID=1448316 RepID=A0A395GV98_9EURO|nr:hypothetical protein BO80DRAFT_503207 [Aspergillus ibericus CBS 121593]RAK99425.1 hypothetical protein BO80DRAFT_503207 [Aspergillus ibericus CBS 121593]
MAHNRFIVGVDFGTTKSGKPEIVPLAPSPRSPWILELTWTWSSVVSYTHTTSTQDPTWWRPNRGSWIIPSVMDYDEEGRLVWGQPATKRPNPLVWAKLLVDGSPDVDVAGSNLQDILRGRFNDLGDRSLTTVIGDYLGALRAGVVADLKAHDLQPQVDWQGHLPRSGRAGRLCTGGPPSVFSVRGGGLIQAGDAVVVCDCGGATTDLATLVMDANDQFDLQGQAKRASERCGGADIDLSLLRNLTLRTNPPANAAEAADARLAVRMAKEHFTGDGPVPIPSQPREGWPGMSRAYRFTKTACRNAFKVVVENVVGQILDQISQAGTRITKLILLGGVATSQYFRDQVLDALRRVLGNQLPTLLPPFPNAIGAVSAGAALQGRNHGRPRYFQSHRTYTIALPRVDWAAAQGPQETHQLHIAISPGRLPPFNSSVLSGSFDTVLGFRPNQQGPHIATCRRGDPTNPNRG